MRAVVLALVLALSPVAVAQPDVASMMEGLLARAASVGDAPRAAVPTGAPADAGYAVRTEDYPCYVAILVNVFMVTTDGVPRDGITVERDVVLPEPDVPCGPEFPSWIGSATATVAPDAYDWIVCTAFEGGLGGWANISGPCHVADFTQATVRGRVGELRLVDCAGDICVTLQQVVGGTNNAPGYADVAFVDIL